MNIPRKQLPHLIAKLCERGARPLSAVYRSEISLLKKDRVTKAPNTIGESVTKVAHINGFLNFKYEGAVNRQRTRENKVDNFKTGKGRPIWFKHATGDPRAIVRHKENNDQLYLQLKVEKFLETVYVLNDQKLNKDSIINLLPKDSESKNQGVDKKVITVCPSLDNILVIVADGVEYHIKG